MSAIAARVVRIDGIIYKPGDVIDVTHLPEHKIAQLFRLRILRPVAED